jgi:hypothetical protein
VPPVRHCPPESRSFPGPLEGGTAGAEMDHPIVHGTSSSRVVGHSARSLSSRQELLLPTPPVLELTTARPWERRLAVGPQVAWCGASDWCCWAGRDIGLGTHVERVSSIRVTTGGKGSRTGAWGVRERVFENEKYRGYWRRPRSSPRANRVIPVRDNSGLPGPVGGLEQRQLGRPRRWRAAASLWSRPK